ncbi:zinc finger protein CONSTANS-like [Dorcoceras hygrometricum]|uniref:Zinc finger protein CONSTANS-like n=1 Tax=Dorcoceras hygrometricum TaxID=472368 RepID=A0A2Z7A177_9LAMI|nr:zinc finger protein CONSTANS-like [Dorcoceras hygrometricum]
MSSEMFVYEKFVLTDPSFPLTDSSAIDAHLHLPTEVFQEIHEYQATGSIPENECGNPLDEADLLNEIASVLLSSSPPSFKLENLSINQSRNDGRNSVLGLKTEECGLKFDANAFLPHSIDEAAVKFMQRSYSSNSSLNNAQNSSFRHRFDSVLETQNLHNQMLSPPAENSIFSSGQMRRVCSTGDLQNAKANHMPKTSSGEKYSIMEEANFKVGRYSAEERKERIDRYKAKRTQRNFNKTIKYACRKTLADNRLRIRGRFARNDEGGEIPKASMFHRYEDYFLNDGFHQEDEEGVERVGSPFHGLDAALQYENYDFRWITSCRKQLPIARSVQFK